MLPRPASYAGVSLIEVTVETGGKLAAQFNRRVNVVTTRAYDAGAARTISGALVHVGNSLGLVVDADTINAKPEADAGLWILDYSGGSKVTINVVSIENGDTVVIETGEPSLSSVVIKYGIDYLGEGLNIQMGAIDNLLGSTPEKQFIDGKDRPFFYLCTHLEFNAINGVI